MNYMSLPGIKQSANVKRSSNVPTLNPSTCDRICLVVANYYNISLAELKSNTRKRRIALPRMIAMYFMYGRTSMTLLQIGKMFNRDHSTVIHSRTLINDLLKVDLVFKNEIEEIKNKL
jgi:chromosomal replication initiator protein